MTPNHPFAARRYLISGRVQGVFYRASAQRQAESLGLRGWVRNRSDGRVELLAAGPVEAVEKLAEWLAQGPPQARVDDVQQLPAEPPAHRGFLVLDTA